MTTEKLFCVVCQCDVAEPDIAQVQHPDGVSFHLKASCPKCGRYLKFLAQGGPPKLHFGKYKNRTIADVAREDADYLHWLYSQDIKPKLKQQIDEALSGL